MYAWDIGGGSKEDETIKPKNIKNHEKDFNTIIS